MYEVKSFYCRIEKNIEDFLLYLLSCLHLLSRESNIIYYIFDTLACFVFNLLALSWLQIYYKQTKTSNPA